MTVISVMLFVVILWEAFVTQRSVVWTYHTSVHLEWSPSLPISFHRHLESVKVFV
jgi:hypothetical protein